MKQTLFFCVLVAGVMALCPALALHEKSAETRIEDLSKRIATLEEVSGQKTSLPDWCNKITVSGLIETEAGYERFEPAAGGPVERSGDIVLSTFELGLDAEFCDHAGGHVLLLWEEDETEPMDLDEGYISLVGSDTLPLYLHAGKQYIPFGNMDTYFISDPLTLELGETRESAVLAGYHRGLFNVFCGAFNGDVEKTEKDNRIDSFFTGADFSLPEDGDRPLAMTVGISYLSNLADTDALAEANDVDGDGGPDGIRDYVGGISAYLYLEVLHSIYCNAECVCAVDKFHAGELNFAEDGERLRPRAWNFELVYVLRSDIGFGIKCERTDDCDGFLPESRYGGIVFCSLFDNTSLGLEYLRQKYDNRDKSDVVTAQLALEF